MRLARILGAIGRALISAGVIVLLFVAYQLWGTGLQHAQAQDGLENDFLELLESDAVLEAQEVTEAALASVEDQQPSEPVAAETEPDGAETDAGDSGGDDRDEARPASAESGGPAGDPVGIEQALADVEYTEEYLEVLYPEPGKSLARIVIPDIKVDQIVVEGVSVEDLRKGPGHYDSTPNPGQAGNAAVAGHRTTYGAPFHRIDELEPGDEIIVTTIQGTFTYLVKENAAADGSVKGHFIVSPSDTWVLGQSAGENLLTLTACHPKYSARQRIIVQAELVGDPAPTIPRGEAGDLEPVVISAGEQDERASEAPADGDVVISDEVAADDDPSVEADGTPVAEQADGTEQSADDAADVSEEAAPSGDEPGTQPEASGDAGSGTAAELTEDDIELTSGSSPFDGETDFGEGLNGDRTKIRPAIMWGIAGGAIWLAAWFIGKRLNRKWTLYTVGIAPFALVLWSCFVNIDQALPSY